MNRSMLAIGLLMLAMALLVSTAQQVRASSTTPEILTDASMYMPGSTATISGYYFTAL